MELSLRQFLMKNKIEGRGEPLHRPIYAIWNRLLRGVYKIRYFIYHKCNLNSHFGPCRDFRSRMKLALNIIRKRILLTWYLNGVYLSSKFCIIYHSNLLIMESLCIICLNAIPSAEASHVERSQTDPQNEESVHENTDTTPSFKNDVARLQNCRHTFHDHCLTAWIEVFPAISLTLMSRLPIPVLLVVQLLIKLISQIQSRVNCSRAHKVDFQVQYCVHTL